MTEVELPDGVIAEFPDEMSESDIKSVLRKKFLVEPQAPIVEPPSTLRTPVRQTPVTEQDITLADPEFGGALIRRGNVQAGFPSAVAGLSPEQIPSGKRIIESPVGALAAPALQIAGIPPALSQPAATVGSSLAKTGLGIADYLSSPQGTIELVGSLSPARLLVLGKWAYDMSKGAYGEAAEFGKLLAKENKTPEDYQKLSDHAVNALAMGLGAGGVVKHGAKDIKKLAQDLNMPEGKIAVEDRGDVAQGIFNEFEARRQAEAGSPFTLLEPPSSPISMGVRTQPALSGAPTFEPSRIPMGEQPVKLTPERTPDALQQKSEGSAKAPEARVVTEKSLAEMPLAEQAKVGHGPGIEYGITLTEADVPRLEAGYAKAGKEMVDAALKGDAPGQQAAFGRMNFYGGALQGATRGKHKAAAANYELFKQRREAEGRPIPEPAKGGEPVEKAKEETRVLEPEVEGVAALDPQSGTPLSATESLINRLEALKFSNQGLAGNLYTLDPKIIQRVGKQLWNDAISTAQFAIRAGKSIAEAIDAALAHIRRTRTGIDEAPMRAELQRILGHETPETPAARPAATATPPPVPSPTAAPVDPITGEPAKVVTAKEAKAMESKVKIPAETDVKKLTEQIDLFNREIGDALESGGQFLPKELRPDVAKGAPAEKGTVTNKAINQYFVNKLSSIRKQMQAARNRIAQQADIESQVYFDTLQKRFETAFRQVQELRRTSHEALYFWNKIRAEYQDIARAAGEMPEMKKQKPIIDQIWKDFRDGQPGQAGRHFVDYLRMNLFTPGSWTLDFGTNMIASAARIPAWAIMDMGAMATGRAPTRMFSAIRALQSGMRNWNPLGKRYRLPDQIEAELGMTAGGEFGGRGREVFVDFSEILKDRPEMADKLRHIDKLIGAPVRMKRAVDSFFGRFGAAAELYNRAYIEGKSRGLRGDELKTFVEEFVQNPSEAAIARAIKTGKELKFNRDLTKWEEAFSGNILTKLVVEAFPRWTLQFIRWGGEMIGADPVFFKDLVTGKATPEQAVNYLTKAATGWGGIYAFNQLAYDNIDANSMEYVKEDGNRVRLSGRTPAPELFFITAMLRGDTEKAKAALKHLSLPGAKLLSGEPAGILSPLIDTIRQSIEGRYTAEQTARELTKLVNDAIPGKSVLALIRSIHDPTIREGIGAPIPGVASLLPQRVNPTTGEPLAPKTRIPGTSIELPTVGGTPFPGAERVLNDVESALLDHGLGNVRPRRTSIIDLPAEDVPKPVRKEYEQMVGRNVKELIGEEIKSPEFWQENSEIRREILSQLLTEARSMAREDLADKYGTSGEPVKSVPLNIQRLPKRFQPQPASDK